MPFLIAFSAISAPILLAISVFVNFSFFKFKDVLENKVWPLSSLIICAYISLLLLKTASLGTDSVPNILDLILFLIFSLLSFLEFNLIISYFYAAAVFPAFFLTYSPTYLIPLPL